jgi:hypothetical protein
MLFFNNTLIALVIFCFIQFSLNSPIRYRSSSILIENISYFLEWTFSVRFTVTNCSRIPTVLEKYGICICMSTCSYIHVCMFQSFCSHFNNGVDMTIKKKMLWGCHRDCRLTICYKLILSFYSFMPGNRPKTLVSYPGCLHTREFSL